MTDRTIPKTLEERVAEFLHKKICKEDHTKPGTWFFEESWDDSNHHTYLEVAKEAIKMVKAEITHEKCKRKKCPFRKLKGG